VIRIALLVVLLFTLAWAFWRLVDGVIEVFGGTTVQQTRRVRRPAVKLVRDPVCGTWVSPDTSRQVRVGEQVQYFCSDRCLKDFEKRA